ncbi:hypothetical protein KVR01_012060 [Diaporthe batatas]|uniref:uncharacterized protein n=1 Tax=Diaporthe batatas TaxID=748121 RepID=UPI001D053674|nr:uncharacterized protein KVR01_012060 [Diaporthe batatas]KAG8158299.1 hypothetical protein KVR01_012060 [Diaporthe batatas]
MAYIRLQESSGDSWTPSTCDSSVGMQNEHQPKREPLYSNFKKHLNQQEKHWLLTRDIELVRPLQIRYSAYEADIMTEIRRTEDEQMRTYNRRWREMRGVRGPAKVAWELYKLKVRLCSGWNHYQLHGRWKHAQLKAKRKELAGSYVRAQMSRRVVLLAELVSFADAQALDDRDEECHVNDVMLSHVLARPDDLFRISRDLDLGIENPWKDKQEWKALNPITLSVDAPVPYMYGWGL